MNNLSQKFIEDYFNSVPSIIELLIRPRKNYQESYDIINFCQFLGYFPQNEEVIGSCTEDDKDDLLHNDFFDLESYHMFLLNIRQKNINVSDLYHQIYKRILCFHVMCNKLILCLSHNTFYVIDYESRNNYIIDMNNLENYTDDQVFDMKANLYIGEFCPQLI
jgi:hypothetical protein